jgi:hypothetical protein
MQEKLQEIVSSIRRPAYLPERMFPQLRERIGPALDLVVEFSTLGEYRLNADGVLCAASALTCASEREPQMGGAGATRPEAVGSAGCAGYGTAARAAVSRIVAGGAAGKKPAATPAARRPSSGAPPASKPRRPACEGKPVAVPEQLCLAV